MRPAHKTALMFGLPVLTIYVVAYVLLVDTHKPSVIDGGHPIYRSSFPKVSTWDKIGYMVFPKAGPANWIFLPIDQCWRSVTDLPSSIIINEDIFWNEYMEYKFASGQMKRSEPKAGKSVPVAPTRK